MKKVILLLVLILTTYSSYSQSEESNKTKNDSSFKKYSYAYITVQGKAFSKKLIVEVDFGDTPEQIKAGKEFSEVLTNKKSYAAILNYMSEHDYELIESRDYNFTYMGTGGSSGIILIMRRAL